jgi:hypothetical protein
MVARDLLPSCGRSPTEGPSSGLEVSRATETKGPQAGWLGLSDPARSEKSDASEAHPDPRSRVALRSAVEARSLVLDGFYEQRLGTTLDRCDVRDVAVEVRPLPRIGESSLPQQQAERLRVVKPLVVCAAELPPNKAPEAVIVDVSPRAVVVNEGVRCCVLSFDPRLAHLVSLYERPEVGRRQPDDPTWSKDAVALDEELMPLPARQVLNHVRGVNRLNTSVGERECSCISTDDAGRKPSSLPTVEHPQTQ